MNIYRGYLFFSVKDRNLFHQVDTIGNIFTSGAATSENITDGVHEKTAIFVFFSERSIKWTPSIIFSRVTQPRVKILPMVFTR